jgi:hypothetical protein
MTASVGSQGYAQVSIRRGGRATTFSVHTLVLTTFAGPCPQGCEARHLDGTRLNNRLSNLRWGTRQENEADKVVHGTAARGEQCNASKLTAEQVLEIRGRYKRGVPGRGYESLAAEYGVWPNAVADIVKGRSWTHI